MRPFRFNATVILQRKTKHNVLYLWLRLDQLSNLVQQLCFHFHRAGRKEAYWKGGSPPVTIFDYSLLKTLHCHTSCRDQTSLKILTTATNRNTRSFFVKRVRCVSARMSKTNIVPALSRFLEWRDRIGLKRVPDFVFQSTAVNKRRYISYRSFVRGTCHSNQIEWISVQLSRTIQAMLRIPRTEYVGSLFLLSLSIIYHTQSIPFEFHILIFMERFATFHVFYHVHFRDWGKNRCKRVQKRNLHSREFMWENILTNKFTKCDINLCLDRARFNQTIQVTHK